jgi:hypothetical protein
MVFSSWNLLLYRHTHKIIIIKIVDCFSIAMCIFPNIQDQKVKDLSQIKKKQPKFIEFEMPAFELLIDA